MTNIQVTYIDCPNCDEEIRNSSLCLNVPANKFDLQMAEDEYICESCERTYFVHVNIESD